MDKSAQSPVSKQDSVQFYSYSYFSHHDVLCYWGGQLGRNNCIALKCFKRSPLLLLLLSIFMDWALLSRLKKTTYLFLSYDDRNICSLCGSILLSDIFNHYLHSPHSITVSKTWAQHRKLRWRSLVPDAPRIHFFCPKVLEERPCPVCAVFSQWPLRVFKAYIGYYLLVSKPYFHVSKWKFTNTFGIIKRITSIMITTSYTDSVCNHESCL